MTKLQQNKTKKRTPYTNRVTQREIKQTNKKKFSLALLKYLQRERESRNFNLIHCFCKANGWETQANLNAFPSKQTFLVL